MSKPILQSRVKLPPVRPKMATVDARLVSYVSKTKRIAARLYYEDLERIYKIRPPDDAGLKALKAAMSFYALTINDEPVSFPDYGQTHFPQALAKAVNDMLPATLGSSTPAADDGRGQELVPGTGKPDRVNRLWQAAQCLDEVIFNLLTGGPLALTPLARPLIQLQIELRDALFGNTGGVLRLTRARGARRPGKSTAKEPPERSEKVSDYAQSALTFEELIEALALATSGIDDSDDDGWLSRCSNALDATIAYLRGQQFTYSSLMPLRDVAVALHRLISKEGSTFFELDWNFRHGQERNSPKGSRMHNDYFAGALICAFRHYKKAKAKISDKRWFDKELLSAGLNDELGPITNATVAKYRTHLRKNSPGFQNDTLTHFDTLLGVLGSVPQPTGKKVRLCIEWYGGDEPKAELKSSPETDIRSLIQVAILYQPRYRGRKKTPKRLARSGTGGQRRATAQASMASCSLLSE